jgi:hypothetical protein
MWVTAYGLDFDVGSVVARERHCLDVARALWRTRGCGKITLKIDGAEWGWLQPEAVEEVTTEG